MSNLVTRMANPRDLSEIIALWRELQETSARYEPRLTSNSGAADWFANYLTDQLRNENAAIFVAADTERIVGYGFGQILRRPTLLSGDCGYIADLVVHNGFRGQGVGRTLYQSLHAWFLEHGVTAVEVQVVRANPASQAFWRKMGFTDFLRTLRREL